MIPFRSFNGEATSAFGAAGGAGERPAKATEQQPAAAAVLPVQWRSVNGGLMVHQLPVGGVARTGQNDGCQGNKGGDFPQGNTTRPLTDGKPERQEKQGLSITGVWGEAPFLSQSAFEIKKNKYNKKP